MRTLLLLPLLFMLSLPTQNPPISSGESPVEVLSFKWSKSRQTPEKFEPSGTIPAPAMIPANKIFERERRSNIPAGERDPNGDTIDGRSAALERSVQEARAPKPVDGYVYNLKVRNAAKDPVDILFWEYQFVDSTNGTIMFRRQFLCAVTIKPDKDKEVRAFSLSAPSEVIHVAGENSAQEAKFQEKIVINRVEHTNGSIWQRKDWNFREIKPGLDRALSTPFGSQMCRVL